MPDEALKPAIRAALRTHEIGDRTPYELSFAGKGASGASFGFMQGDLAAGRPEVRQTLRAVLAEAGMDEAAAGAMVARLSVHLLADPLDPAETRAVNAALQAGRARVDALDELLLGDVYRGVDACVARAGEAGRALAPAAQVAIGLWVNMTGAPTRLLAWLGGGAPQLRRPVPPADTLVDEPAMERYLAATDYFVENPRNLTHLAEAVAAGMRAAGAG